MRICQRKYFFWTWVNYYCTFYLFRNCGEHTRRRSSWRDRARAWDKKAQNRLHMGRIECDKHKETYSFGQGTKSFHLFFFFFYNCWHFNYKQDFCYGIGFFFFLCNSSSFSLALSSLSRLISALYQNHQRKARFQIKQSLVKPKFQEKSSFKLPEQQIGENSKC